VVLADVQTKEIQVMPQVVQDKRDSLQSTRQSSSSPEGVKFCNVLHMCRKPTTSKENWAYSLYLYTGFLYRADWKKYTMYTQKMGSTEGLNTCDSSTPTMFKTRIRTLLLLLLHMYKENFEMEHSKNENSVCVCVCVCVCVIRVHTHTHQLNLKISAFCPRDVLCILHDSHSKQWLFPCTPLKGMQCQP
jgi:hypothetical protein